MVSFYIIDNDTNVPLLHQDIENSLHCCSDWTREFTVFNNFKFKHLLRLLCDTFQSENFFQKHSKKVNQSIRMLCFNISFKRKRSRFEHTVVYHQKKLTLHSFLGGIKRNVCANKITYDDLQVHHDYVTSLDTWTKIHSDTIRNAERDKAAWAEVYKEAEEEEEEETEEETEDEISLIYSEDEISLIYWGDGQSTTSLKTNCSV